MTRIQRMLRVVLAFSWLPFAGIVAVALVLAMSGRHSVCLAGGAGTMPIHAGVGARPIVPRPFYLTTGDTVRSNMGTSCPIVSPKGYLMIAVFTLLAGILWLIRLGDIFNIYELP